LVIAARITASVGPSKPAPSLIARAANFTPPLTLLAEAALSSPSSWCATEAARSAGESWTGALNHRQRLGAGRAADVVADGYRAVARYVDRVIAGPTAGALQAALDPGVGVWRRAGRVR
jgi:hypothetical protein